MQWVLDLTSLTGSRYVVIIAAIVHDLHSPGALFQQGDKAPGIVWDSGLVYVLTLNSLVHQT